MVSSLTIDGQQVYAWVWPPDWQQGLLERLEWMTDVLQAYRGEQQRRSLRLAPRQALEFSVLVEGDDRRQMEALLWGWGGKTFAVPLWFDGMTLAAPLAVASTSIPLDPAGRQFAAGEPVLLVGASPREAELVLVDTVGADLQLAAATASAWPAGTRVYPARLARLDGEASLPRFTGAAATGRLVFEMVTPATWSADAGSTTYRGRPVLEHGPNWLEAPALGLQRKGELLDAGIGLVAFEDEADMPIAAQSGRWLLESRAQVNAWRSRLFALRGKQGSLWVPSWADDLTVLADIASGVNTVDVSWIGYTDQLVGQPGRSDIRIQLHDGTVFYRRITGATVIDSTRERLSLDSALGVAVPKSSIALVSWMALMHNASDSAEFAWFTGDAAETSATFTGYRA